MLKVAAFVATYVFLVGVSYRTAWIAGTLAPLWWPSTGLALGVLVRAPTRAWVPLLGTLGATMVVLGLAGLPAPREPPALVAVIWGVGDVLVPLLGAALIRRFGAQPFRILRAWDVGVFFLCGVLAPAVLSAAIVLLSYALWPGEGPVVRSWGPWWVGEALGILSVAPLILTWWGPGERPLVSRSRRIEAAALLAGLLLVGIVGFDLPSQGLEIILLASATGPLLAWAAIRFGARGAAFATFLLAVIATARTLAGVGPFAEAGLLPYQRVSYSAGFFSLAMIASLLLAVFARERRRLSAQVQAHARRNEEGLALLASVIHSAPVGVAILDRELRFIQVNDAIAKINGVSVAEHLGRPLREVVPGPDGERLARRLQAVLESGEPVVSAEFSARSVAHRGELRTFSVTWFPVAVPGHPPHAVGTFVVDATDRKRYEAELRASEERFRVLAEGMSQIIFTLDRRGNPVRGAFRWNDFTGLPLEDYRPDRWFDAIHPEDRDRIRATVRTVLRRGESVLLRYRLKHRDGSWRHVETFAAPVRDSKGKVREWVGATTDVTERVHSEQARERALAEAQQAIQLREDFLSIASHELKTPLTPLAARLEMIQRWVEAGRPVDLASVQKARAALNRLNFLIGDLLDVARIRSARLSTSREPVSLVVLVRELGETWREQAQQHRLELELPGGSLWVRGERSRLIQVLDNLVGNAIKFSPEGGRIGISLREEGGCAHLSVSDEGIGIPAGDQADLFNRFYRAQNVSTRSYGGLGLGLYITREIVELHGGRIWLESEVGKGTTFHVTLPLIPAAEAAAELH